MHQQQASPSSSSPLQTTQVIPTLDQVSPTLDQVSPTLDKNVNDHENSQQSSAQSSIVNLNMSKCMDSHCKCPCRLVTTELGGIRLDLVILNKNIESSTFRQENGLESELLVTKKHCEELQQNIQLIKNAQNAEVEELNRTTIILRQRHLKPRKKGIR
jgi:hypothetical protein